jgi:hypothetical protein
LTIVVINIGGGLILEVVVKIPAVGGKDEVVDDSVVQGFSRSSIKGFSSVVLTISISSLISSKVSPLELLERSGVAIGADFPSSNESCLNIGL